MRRADVLDDAEYRSAFVANVTAERHRSAADSPAFVHDHVTEHRCRGPINIAIHVEITANHHHRSGSCRAGRNGEIARCNLRVPLDAGNADALSVRILRSGRRHQQGEADQDRFHYAVFRLAICAAVRMPAYPLTKPSTSAM